MSNEPMKLVFTSFRDSMRLDGLKVAVDRHLPKLCSYPTLSYLIMPTTKNLSMTNMEKLCQIILDNNCELIQDFITEVHTLGINQIVFCDWATTEQISHGKFCAAAIIGRYIQNRVNAGEFEFLVEIDFRDGREVL